jgi:hypothetical protein
MKTVLLANADFNIVVRVDNDDQAMVIFNDNFGDNEVVVMTEIKENMSLAETSVKINESIRKITAGGLEVSDVKQVLDRPVISLVFE